MVHFDDIYGLHQWQIESIKDLLEEFPEIKTMTTDELNQKYNDMYLEATYLINRANLLESKADAIKTYIKYFKGIHIDEINQRI